MEGKSMRLLTVLAAGAAIACCAGGVALGAPTPYPTPGVENPVTYTFTAAGSGHLVAYFAGSGAGYDEVLGAKVNGVDTGITGLDDHTSAYGDALDFGLVNAGDTLEFYINVLSTGDVWSSIKANNTDGANHVYSSPYAGDSLIPRGVYVAFEDLPACCSDFNYYDETFVFTNVASSVAEPGAWTLMIGGVFGLGAALRRSRRQRFAAA
jgi:hypothetical protein